MLPVNVLSLAISAVNIKPPPFWPADPALWFAQVESQFACRRITSQRSKFDHVVSSLSPECAGEVTDLILSPPSDQPYQALKEQHTKCTAQSERFMDEVLHGLTFAYSYIDDLLIASSSPEGHLQHLRLVLEQLDKHGILININKSRFGVPSVDFLGHHVDTNGIRPLETKVEVVREFPRPSTQRQLQRFGLVNFYHRFIPNGSTILHPLHALLKQTQKPSDKPAWTEDTIVAFNNVKHALANATLLVHPALNAPTSIMTDASDVAVGGILQQYINGQWCPLSFFSKTLQLAETRYSTYNRELLAIYWQFVTSGTSWKAGIFMSLQIISPLSMLSHLDPNDTLHVKCATWISLANSLLICAMSMDRTILQ